MAPSVEYARATPDHEELAVLFGSAKASPTASARTSARTLVRNNSHASLASRTSTASRALEWMRSVSFRRQTSKDSKTSTSSGTDTSIVTGSPTVSPSESKASLANVTAVGYVPRRYSTSSGTGKQQKPRKGKVPLADLIDVARQLDTQAAERKAVEAQLLRTQVALDLELARAADTHDVLAGALQRMGAMQAEMDALADQLAALRTDRETAEVAAREAEVRSKEDRKAAEMVYDMYVSLLVEHQAVLHKVEQLQS